MDRPSTSGTSTSGGPLDTTSRTAEFFGAVPPLGVWLMTSPSATSLSNFAAVTLARSELSARSDRASDRLLPVTSGTATGSTPLLMTSTTARLRLTLVPARGSVEMTDPSGTVSLKAVDGWAAHAGVAGR